MINLWVVSKKVLLYLYQLLLM